MSFRLENGRYVAENSAEVGAPAGGSQEAQSDRSSPPEGSEVPLSSTPPGIRHPPPNVLADVMEENQRTHARLLVHQNTLIPILRADENLVDEEAQAANQILFNHVSQITHHLSHAQHVMSDIMINFSRPPPRQLRARPFVIQSLVQSAVVQAGPIAFNIGETLMTRPATSASTTTTSSSQSTTSSARPSAGPAAAADGGRNAARAAAFHNVVHDAVHNQAVAAAAANTEFALGGMFGNARVSVRTAGPGVGGGGGATEVPVSTDAGTGATRGPAATRTRHIRTASDDIQALVNSALHEALRSIPGVSAAPTRGTTTASPGQQQGRAGQQNLPNGSLRQQIPMSVPLTPQMAIAGGPGVGNFNSFDPFLQCSSHHIASARSPQSLRGRPVRSAPTSAPTSRTASLDRRSTVNRPRAAPPTQGSTWMSPPTRPGATGGFLFGVAPAGIAVSHGGGHVHHHHHHHHHQPNAGGTAAGAAANPEPLVAGVGSLLNMMMSGAGQAVVAPSQEDVSVLNMIQVLVFASS